MDDQKRSSDAVEGRYALAVLYTLGFLALIGALLFVEIPTNNREMMLTLIGLMSAAQLGILKYYYDGAKSSETAQIANIARASRADATIQKLAETAVPPTTVGPAGP